MISTGVGLTLRGPKSTSLKAQFELFQVRSVPGEKETSWSIVVVIAGVGPITQREDIDPANQEVVIIILSGFYCN